MTGLDFGLVARLARHASCERMDAPIRSTVAHVELADRRVVVELTPRRITNRPAARILEVTR